MRHGPCLPGAYSLVARINKMSTDCDNNHDSLHSLSTDANGRHCSQYLTCINSSDPMRKVLLSPFYTGGTEGLNNSSKVTRSTEGQEQQTQMCLVLNPLSQPPHSASLVIRP